MRTRTAVAGGVGVALVWVSAILPAARALPAPDGGSMTSELGRSPAECGPDDAPETGLQGDVPRADQESGRAERGYSCGLTLVGANDLSGASSSALAWSGHCAYVRAGDGIRVLDVSDPTGPVEVALLPVFGSSENMSAATTDDRAVLVYGRGVYDVVDCEEPELVGQIDWSGGTFDVDESHNVKVNRAGTKVYASFGVKEADITDLGDPGTWTVRSWSCETVAQSNPVHASPVGLCDRTQAPQQIAHEPETDGDGTRLYTGNQTLLSSAPGGQVEDETMRIIDLTTTPPTVIAELPGPGHGITATTIGGKDYLLHSDETAPGIPQPAERRASGCLPYEATPFAGAAESYLTDISDETAPVRVSHLGLAINRRDPESCLAALDSAVNSTIHYHTVDDTEDATFAMLSMKNAGLRIFDIRDPAAPTEVAYFNPAQIRLSDGSTTLDRARTHTRYDPTTGLIWLLTESGGFWVLDLQTQVRERLGLDEPPGWAPGSGRPPWAGRRAEPGEPKVPLGGEAPSPRSGAAAAPPPAPGSATRAAYDSFLNYCRL